MPIATKIPILENYRDYYFDSKGNINYEKHSGKQSLRKRLGLKNTLSKNVSIALPVFNKDVVQSKIDELKAELVIQDKSKKTLRNVGVLHNASDLDANSSV